MAKDIKKKNTNSKKNTNKKIDKIETNMKNEIVKMIKIVVIVLIFLVAFYFLTVMIVDNSKDEDIKETTIQYEEILAGSSFSVNDKEYLVIYYDKTDTEIYSSIYQSIMTYKNKEDSLRVYTVDMSNQFNKKYISDNEGNSNVTDVSDLSINGPTLIKITDGKVLEYIEGSEQILNYLK